MYVNAKIDVTDLEYVSLYEIMELFYYIVFTIFLL